MQHKYNKITILTGAGLSAESGLATFRDAGGIWAKYDWREVATPEGFANNPTLVHQFYNARRRALKDVTPNAAHMALARLEAARPNTLFVTQNIDNLHEVAGAKNLIHMHGELNKVFCTHCDTRQVWSDNLDTKTQCPSCGATGNMRPDVVWFGEMPYHMERIAEEISESDLFISIGTSGNVYPAAGFVAAARKIGAHTVELNLEPSEGASQFAEAHYGPATEIVPAFIDKILADTKPV